MKVLEIISTSAVVLISIFNFFLASRVYKLEKENAYSKLSINVMQRELENQLITYEDSDFNRAFYAQIRDLGTSEGFPNISLSSKYGHSKAWRIQLSNLGDFASTNIKLNYSIIVKKSAIEFGKDENGKEDRTLVINDKRVDFFTYNKEVDIPYMGGGQVKEIPILIYDGEFPEAELIVKSLYCDQNKFIKKPIKVDVIEHPDFDWIEDSHHSLRMLGLSE